MDVISYQKIFGLGGLECHIVEIWRDVTTEHEDSARILEAEFAMLSIFQDFEPKVSEALFLDAHCEKN